MEEPLKIKISDLNQHIVCSLCAGYYIDATTITECLHTFCKSCIVKFLQTSKCCPQCSLKVHETQPLLNLKADRVMQDIVFKLVPELYETEEKRKQEFFKARGLIKEQKEDNTSNGLAALSTVIDDPTAHYYSNDELLCLCIERYGLFAEGCGNYQMPTLTTKFVRCSVRTCVHHLKQMLRTKLEIPTRYDLQVICSDRDLDDWITLKQVWLMCWLTKPSPLMLFYRVVPAATSVSA